MKKEVIETAQNIIGVYNAYTDDKMENGIKKVIANPDFDGHALVEPQILSRKQIKNFWKQVVELKQKFIITQEKLTGCTYRTDLEFTIFVDTLWDYRVRFAVENKRVRDYTPVDFCLIKGRALQLTRLDKTIDFQEYNNVFEFMSTLSNCLVA